MRAHCTGMAAVSTFVGMGDNLTRDGPAAEAGFSFPCGIAFHNGTIYVAEYGGNAVRKVSPDGQVSTLAGSGQAGWRDGVGDAACFHSPTDVVVDADGNSYVADARNHRIRKITAGGVVSTLVGCGTNGYEDGPLGTAKLSQPAALLLDSEGALYVAEWSGRIRKVSLAAGVVTTLAGSGVKGCADGVGAEASFNEPNGMAFDATGDMIVADRMNNLIRKVTVPEGVVTTLAGSGAQSHVDGVGAGASFNVPTNLVIDYAGSMFVTDQGGMAVRKVTPAGVVSTLAGGSHTGFVDGVGAAAAFHHPSGVALDGAGNLLVADLHNNCIRLLKQVAVPELPPKPRAEVACTFVNDFATLLADSALADVTFVVKGEHITAHRAVLASRSAYVSACIPLPPTQCTSHSNP